MCVVSVITHSMSLFCNINLFALRNNFMLHEQGSQATLQKLLADVCPTQFGRDRKYKNWNGMVWLEDVEILKFK